jgi:uncharacterized protein
MLHWSIIWYMTSTSSSIPFWKAKTLEEMTPTEWESLCDGCARCCIVKFEDIDTREIFMTDVVCSLLDTDRCQCTDYPHRHELVPTCLMLTPALVRKLTWMPETCAYRRLAAGKPLEWWHPLVSGSLHTVHDAGISVRGKVFLEKDIPEDELEDHIFDPDEDN